MSDVPSRPRVLIVEDEFLIRMTLAEALADEGYTVVEASSGDEALELFQANPAIDVLMTDIQLPGKLNGLRLVEMVRQVRPDVPVIYMTGRPDNMAGLRRSPHDAFVAKPYLPSEIIQALRRLTSGPTA